MEIRRRSFLKFLAPLVAGAAQPLEELLSTTSYFDLGARKNAILFGRTQLGVDFTFSSEDLALTVDDFSEQFINPAVKNIADAIDSAALRVLRQKLTFTERVNRTYENNLLARRYDSGFGSGNVRPGSVLSVRKPPRYVAGSDPYFISTEEKGPIRLSTKLPERWSTT